MKKHTLILAITFTLLALTIIFMPTTQAKYVEQSPTFRMTVYRPLVLLGNATVNLKPGYYYVEAWGGNGGNTLGFPVNPSLYSASGGLGGQKNGVYHVTGATTLVATIGMRGYNQAPVTLTTQGGSGYASGGTGARGGSPFLTGTSAQSGAGGGGSTGITLGGTLYQVAAGGGGAGGMPTYTQNTNGGWLASPGLNGSDTLQAFGPQFTTVMGVTLASNNNVASQPAGMPGVIGRNGAIGGTFGGGGGGGGGAGVPGGYGGRNGDWSQNGSGSDRELARGDGGGGGRNFPVGTIGGNVPSAPYPYPTNVRPNNPAPPTGLTGSGSVIITFLGF